MRIRRTLWSITFTASTVALLFAMLGISNSCYQRFQAEKLISAFTNINVGITTENKAKEILRPFNTFSNISKFPGEPIGNGYDAYTFRNWLLSYCHICRPKFVHLGIEYKNGFVTAKYFNFFEEPRMSASMSEVQQHPTPKSVTGSTNQGRQISFSNYGVGIDILTVTDDISVPPAQRRLDWQFDLSCLTDIFPCKDPHTVLVGAFR